MIIDRIGSYFLFIQGFRNARVANSETILRKLRASFEEVDVQLLRADRVAGKEHIMIAARNAVDSFRGKDRRAKHLSMEFLLFASGEHQIVEAIKLLGITSSSTELVLVGLSEAKLDSNSVSSEVAKIVNGVPDDTVLDVETLPKPAGLKRAYKISDRELNSSRMFREAESSVLRRLVIERSALLMLEN
jgi:KEOPS complex subunit Cgi121